MKDASATSSTLGHTSFMAWPNFSMTENWQWLAKVCFEEVLHPEKMLSYKQHRGFSCCAGAFAALMGEPCASTVTQDSAAMQLESTGNNGCCVARWGESEEQVRGDREWRAAWVQRETGTDWEGLKKENRKNETQTGELECEREQQWASSPGIGLCPVQLSAVWLWVRRRGWRLCYALLLGHTVQLEAAAVASAQI